MNKKIEGLIFKKDTMNPEQFMEAYRRIQAEDKIVLDKNHLDEYDICAQIAKLCVSASDGMNEAAYIIDRTYEIWIHLMKTKKSEIERVHREIKLEVVQ